MNPPVTRACISNLESGKRSVSAFQLVQFSALFDVSADSLLSLPQINRLPAPPDAWNYVLSELDRVGPLGEPALPHKAIEVVIGQLGGWAHFHHLPREQAKKFFTANYRRFYDKLDALPEPTSPRRPR